MLKVVLFVCLYFIIGIMYWLFILKIEYDDYNGSIENFIYSWWRYNIWFIYLLVFMANYYGYVYYL